MLTIYQRTVREPKLQQAAEIKDGVWIHLEQPTDEEIGRAVRACALDEGLVRDGLDQYEVPRLEVEDGSLYLFTRVPYGDRDEVMTAPFLAVLCKTGVVTVVGRPFAFLEGFASGGADFYTTQKTKFVLQLFSAITAQYSGFLTAILKNVRRASVAFEMISNRDIIQFVRFEATLNDFLGALVPTEGMLRALLAGKLARLYEEDRDLIEDLMLGNGQLVELCRSNVKNIANIREAYSTIMTNNLNRVIKLFTSLTVLLTVPTMIASLYGMNVRLPFAGHPFAFNIIAGFLVATSAVLLYVFIRNRWL